MRPATGAGNGDDVMELGLPTPDHTDPEPVEPEIPWAAEGGTHSLGRF